MPIYSTRYLRDIASGESDQFWKSIVTESKDEHKPFDIFLSHSFLDKEVVRGLYRELTKQGYEVYVDWMVDPHLDRANVTKQSAERIRHRLASSKSLLLAISENAELSKWMPWELGYIDGHKHKCAIVPVSDKLTTPTTFRGYEYLQLYPYIRRSDIEDYAGRIYAVESANRYVTFHSWLKLDSEPRYNMTSIEQS